MTVPNNPLPGSGSKRWGAGACESSEAPATSGPQGRPLICSSLSGKDDGRGTLLVCAHSRITNSSVPGAPGFPEQVEKIGTLSDLIWWLGNTPFPPDHPGGAGATSELLTILTAFNPDPLPVLLEYLQRTSSDVAVPSWSRIQAVKDGLIQGSSAQSRELAGQTLSWQVKRWRPNLRGDIAGWIARQM